MQIREQPQINNNHIHVHDLENASNDSVLTYV